jgi:hypothetical protein
MNTHEFDPPERALADLVSDWGGFERLVAQLHETGDVTVEHNVTLTGRSGASRQIDVLVRHTQGLYEHLIVVECKYRSTPVERLHIDALATTIREIGASRGVIFSTQNFQSGALSQAKHDNISLFLLRELTDAEWGRPGRFVDVWLHTVSLAVGNLEMPDVLLAATGPVPTRPLALEFDFSEGESRSRTPVHLDGKPDATVEDLIQRAARRSAQKIYKPVLLTFGDKEDGAFKYAIRVKIAPLTPMSIRVDAGLLTVPAISFKLGLLINQSHFKIDRKESFAFALAVENCITKQVAAASRRKLDARTQIRSAADNERAVDEPAWQNGSLATVWIRPFIDFSKFDNVVLPPDTAQSVTLEL